jgi:hypothetical protein
MSPVRHKHGNTYDMLLRFEELRRILDPSTFISNGCRAGHNLQWGIVEIISLHRHYQHERCLSIGTLTLKNTLRIRPSHLRNLRYLLLIEERP